MRKFKRTRMICQAATIKQLPGVKTRAHLSDLVVGSFLDVAGFGGHDFASWDEIGFRNLLQSENFSLKLKIILKHTNSQHHLLLPGRQDRSCSWCREGSLKKFKS